MENTSLSRTPVPSLLRPSFLQRECAEPGSLGSKVYFSVAEEYVSLPPDVFKSGREMPVHQLWKAQEGA